MAISKSSIRHQFTLNTNKEKENVIAKFLDSALNPNSTIKEILYNHIVSNYKALSLKECNFIVDESNIKLLKESDVEVKSHEVSELEQNEMNELSKFL